MLAAIRSFFFTLQGLHRFGSFFKPLSAKKSCSPAVKMNSSLQSIHRRTLSVYSYTVGLLRSFLKNGAASPVGYIDCVLQAVSLSGAYVIFKPGGFNPDLFPIRCNHDLHPRPIICGCRPSFTQRDACHYRLISGTVKEFVKKFSIRNHQYFPIYPMFIISI